MERQSGLGGNVARVDLTAPYLDSARDLITTLVTRVGEHRLVEVMLRSEVSTLEGFVGNFTATVETVWGDTASVSQFKVGNVIVATGYKEFDATRVTHYGYGKLPNVITSFDFEKMLRAGRIQMQ